MGVEVTARKDVEHLKNAFLHANKTQRKRIIFDFDFASSMEEALKCDFKIPDYSTSSEDPSLFMNQVIDYIYELEQIAEYVIEMYKRMGFYNYQRSCFRTLSKENAETILKEFLEYFFRDLLKLYEDLVKNNRVDIADLGPNAGESYLFNMLKSYYILINGNYYNHLFLLETIIHELMHIYSNMFLQNYRHYGLQNLNNGFFGEALSMYAELSLFEFLKRRKLFGEELLLHRNMLDFAILRYFKTINYVAKMYERADTDFYSDNSSYRITGKIGLQQDQGVPFFEYPSADYAKGNLLDFKYALGGIEAFNFLRREQAGEDIKRMIDTYLLGFQFEDQMDKYLEEYHDLDFMYANINERTQELKKRYPIPGYDI